MRSDYNNTNDHWYNTKLLIGVALAQHGFLA